MTRINSAINVRHLTDEHLIAEHREIKRLPSQYLKSKNSGSLNKIPTRFCLGKGHVLFFMDKFKFTFNRYQDLLNECKSRGFNVIDYSNNWLLVDKINYKDYSVSEIEKDLLKERITQRIIESKKQYFHYKGEKITKENAIDKLNVL
jgi:deoxyribonuclease (pyrimidine dimer)